MKLLTDDTNIDLHIHTNYSDGLENIDSIIKNALKKNITTISITDHDNMYAYSEINIKKLKNLGLIVIPGVEMTCLYKECKIHLLAYDINPNLFHLLKKVFYKHYKGHIHKYISFENAKRLVHVLGGKIILAHPYKYSRSNYKGEELVNFAIENNFIDGIECFHSYHNVDETKLLLEYALKHNLYVTGGSDFHYLERKVRNDIKSKGIGRLEVIGKNIDECIDYFNKSIKR